MAKEDYAYNSKSELGQTQMSVDATKEQAPGKNYAIDSTPKLVDIDRLYARDNSGGPDWEPDTANFGDGGFKRGQKIGA